MKITQSHVAVPSSQDLLPYYHRVMLHDFRAFNVTTVVKTEPVRMASNTFAFLFSSDFAHSDAYNDSAVCHQGHTVSCVFRV